MNLLRELFAEPPVQLDGVGAFDRSRLTIGVPSPEVDLFEGPSLKNSLGRACRFWNATFGIKAFASNASYLEHTTSLLLVKTDKRIFMASDLRVIDGEIRSCTLLYNPRYIRHQLSAHFKTRYHDQVLERAWAHEIGHCAGLRKRRRSGKGNVMWPHISSAPYSVAWDQKDYLEIN